MTRAALLLCLLGAAARADVVDLSDTESRRPGRPGDFAVRVEAGSEFAPWGLVGAGVSFFTANALGGAEIELGAGVGTGGDGLQAGLGLRQLLGDGGDYFVFELALAGNSKKELGRDPTLGSGRSSHLWSSLGIGFEHRAGLLTISVVGALAFTTSLDLVPHALIHGGIGLAF